MLMVSGGLCFWQGFAGVRLGFRFLGAMLVGDIPISFIQGREDAQRMPRKPRVQFPNAIHHIVTRGDGKQKLFHDAGHYQRFTEGLEAEVLRWVGK